MVKTCLERINVSHAGEFSSPISAILSLLAILIFSGQPSFAEIGFTWKACENQQLGNVTSPFDANGKFVPYCAPDTLYTWQSSRSVQAHYLSGPAQNGAYISDIAVFTARTPLSSHGYGEESIRIKLIPDAVFIDTHSISSPDRRAQSDCDFYKKKYASVYKKMVLFSRTSLGYSEYILCSDGPIQSFSWGTKEHLQEMLREMSWYKHHPRPQDHDALERRLGLFNDQKLDSKDFSVAGAENRVARMEKIAANNLGKVILLKKDASYGAHFSTNLPGYYNPIPGGAWRPTAARAGGLFDIFR